MAALDIIPTLDFYEQLNAQIAQDYFFFTFLTQDYPTPERLISGDPEYFMRLILLGLSDIPVPYDEMALKAYLTANTTPEAITAMGECFRAGYHIDRVHDRADRDAGNTITCPSLVMWGDRGVVGTHFDVEDIWRRWCDDPVFAPMPGGHFIPEEVPGPALAALKTFLAPEL